MKTLDRWDIVSVSGGIVAIVGIAFVYWPASLIVAGLLLVALGIAGARAHALADTRVKPHK